MKAAHSVSDTATTRQRIAEFETRLQTTFAPGESQANHAACDGIFLRKTTFARFPLTLSPLRVRYQGDSTSVRFRMRGEWYVDGQGRHEHIPGVTFGGLIHETGIFLTVTGSLLLFTQGDERWFELVHPRSAFYRKPKEARHIPYAQFRRLADGTVTVCTG